MTTQVYKHFGGDDDDVDDVVTAAVCGKGAVAGRNAAV